MSGEVCVFRHGDGSICGHVHGHELHGPLDYADYGPTQLGKALAQVALERPRSRGVRHGYQAGQVVPADDPLSVLVDPNQEAIPWE